MKPKGFSKFEGSGYLLLPPESAILKNGEID